METQVSEWKHCENYPYHEALEFETVIKIPKEEIENKVVLDYGSGNGRDANKLMLMNPKKIICCDISSDNLKIVKELNPDEKIITILLEKSDIIPMEDESVDVINCNGVLHHIKNPQKIVKEFYRILKPKGLVYIMLYTEYLFKILNEDITFNIKNGAKDIFEAFGRCTDKCEYSTFYSIIETLELFDKFRLIDCKSYRENKFRIYKHEKWGD